MQIHEEPLLSEEQKKNIFKDTCTGNCAQGSLNYVIYIYWKVCLLNTKSEPLRTEQSHLYGPHQLSCVIYRHEG